MLGLKLNHVSKRGPKYHHSCGQYEAHLIPVGHMLAPKTLLSGTKSPTSAGIGRSQDGAGDACVLNIFKSLPTHFNFANDNVFENILPCQHVVLVWTCVLSAFFISVHIYVRMHSVFIHTHLYVMFNKVTFLQIYNKHQDSCRVPN